MIYSNITSRPETLNSGRAPPHAMTDVTTPGTENTWDIYSMADGGASDAQTSCKSF